MVVNTYETITQAGKRLSVTHDLTDAQCAQVIKEQELSASSFAKSLVRQYEERGLSQNQTTWLHILADELIDPQPSQTLPEVNLPAIAGLFAQALDAGAKRVVIRALDRNKQQITLRLNKRRRINITGEGPYDTRPFYGSLGVDRGDFRPGAQFNEDVVQALAALEANPAGIASEYGRLTGNCCFCGLELSDARSVTVGYGPICADKFGLPWGEADVLKELR